MPAELCLLLRSFRFLAEDTISLQGAPEISQTYFCYSPDESNQEHLAHRSSYLRFTAVDSKAALSSVLST